MEMTKARSIKPVSSRVLKTANGYGLLVYVDSKESRIYPDLTTDQGKLCSFSDVINQGTVSSLHIEEMIEDFLE